MELVAYGDIEGLAVIYTKDVKMMSAGAPALEGRAEIKKAMSSILESGISGLDVNMEDIHSTEDLIASEGLITLFAG